MKLHALWKYRILSVSSIFTLLVHQRQNILQLGLPSIEMNTSGILSMPFETVLRASKMRKRRVQNTDSSCQLPPSNKLESNWHQTSGFQFPKQRLRGWRGSVQPPVGKDAIATTLRVQSKVYSEVNPTRFNVANFQGSVHRDCNLWEGCLMQSDLSMLSKVIIKYNHNHET